MIRPTAPQMITRAFHWSPGPEGMDEKALSMPTLPLSTPTAIVVFEWVTKYVQPDTEFICGLDCEDHTVQPHLCEALQGEALASACTAQLLQSLDHESPSSLGNFSQNPRGLLGSRAVSALIWFPWSVASWGVSPIRDVSEQKTEGSREGLRTGARFGGGSGGEKQQSKSEERKIMVKETSEGEKQSRAWQTLRQLCWKWLLSFDKSP